jgi:hypothetical protein
MAGKKPYQPVFRQFISEIEKGFFLLDENTRAEVAAFIKTQQHKNGAFTNRSGTPDLYYSLFGVWLANALKMDEQQTQLKKYISIFQKENEKVVDKFSLLLISLVLNGNSTNKPSIFKLLQWILEGGKNLNTAYRFFLFMLSFDALFGKSRGVYFLARIFLNFYNPAGNLPCSFLAALLLARFLTGQKVEKEASVLLNYFERGKGFKVFREQENADLLSTAVALFALKKVGKDLRMVAPDCLNLVQQNYENGAFLAGDGDLSRDLEYTFYGLLSLGVLS